MNRYHYLGSGPLCGYQMRYLIESERYGYRGGLAFSSSAWRLETRDKWIGWDEERRLEGLGKVVCNSRFLMVPHVRVKNLASYELSQSISQNDSARFLCALAGEYTAGVWKQCEDKGSLPIS